MVENPAIPSSSMISASNLLITGGTFTPTFNDNRQFHAQSNSKDPLHILKKYTAPSAFQDSEAQFDSPKCHPRTRTAVLAKIMDWILARDNESGDLLIMWLTGAAGAGKSSIAHSTVENCLKQSETLVLGCFFFKRSDGTRNYVQPLVATLAYQIYRVLPVVQSKMASIIEDDPLIFTKKLDYQFKTLIMAPLQALHESGHITQSQSRRLIVIDGLDECISRTSQVLILNVISDAVRTFKLPVVFLIASRPEHDIKEAFKSNSMCDMHNCVMLDKKYQPDEDIRVFLDDNFRRIKETHPFKRMIPINWPEDEVLETLVKKSTGQFIYPATVIKFIESIRHQPVDRLKVILKLRTPLHETPFEQLDLLYCHILSCVDSASIEKVFKIFGYMFIWPKIRPSPSEIASINRFIPLDDGELSILLCDLGALVQDTDVKHISLVRLWHASLEDFFFDHKRSKEFYIDEKDTLSSIVVRSLQIISTLRDDVGYSKIAYLSFFRRQADDCKISTALIEVAKFSIGKSFFQSGSGDEKSKFRFTLDMLEIEYLDAFLRLSQRVASHGYKKVYDHLLKQMNEIFASNMEYYSTHGVLTLILCLGVHASICCISIEQNPGGHSDILSLAASLNLPSAYLQVFRDFIQDPTRSGRYCIGPEAYERATLFCMQTLAYYKRRGIRHLPCVDKHMIPNGQRGKYLRDSNCNECNHIERARSGLWEIKSEDLFYCDIEKINLFVGYIIYFLPLCGRSKALIQRCRHPESFLDAGEFICPHRQELAYQQSKEYLRRVRLPLLQRMCNWVANICGEEEPLDPEIN